MRRPSKKYRRRILVVDAAMQQRMIAWITWPAILCLTIGVIGLIVLAGQLYDEVSKLEIVVPGIAKTVLVALLFLAGAVAFVVFHALQISHRVAGPVYRMCLDLERFRAGNTAHRVRLRDGDFLCKLADQINLHLDWCESELGAAEHSSHQQEGPEAAAAADAESEGSVASPAQEPQLQ